MQIHGVNSTSLWFVGGNRMYSILMYMNNNNIYVNKVVPRCRSIALIMHNVKYVSKQPVLYGKVNKKRKKQDSCTHISPKIFCPPFLTFP